MKSYYKRNAGNFYGNTCKQEFLDEVKDKDLLCAFIVRQFQDSRSYKTKGKRYILKVGFTKEGYAEFLKSIDFKYNGDFKIPYATIWYNDGTWSERAEYDGKEWYEHKKFPNIPKTLLTGVVE